MSPAMLLWLIICQMVRLVICESDIFIKHALVVLVGVGKYDSNLADISIPVLQDVRVMYNLWSGYGHTVVDTEQYYGSLYLEKHAFEQFMNTTVKKLLISNKKVYDAFIFCSSSHGDHHSMMFSDSSLDEAFEDIELFMYGYFSNEELMDYAMTPKLFFINKCRNSRRVKSYSFSVNFDEKRETKKVIIGDNFRWFYPTYPGDTAYGDASGSYLFQTIQTVMEEQYEKAIDDNINSQSFAEIHRKMKKELRGYGQTLHDGGSLITGDVYFKLNFQTFTNFCLLFIANCINKKQRINLPTIEAINSSIFYIVKQSKMSLNEFKKSGKSKRKIFLQGVVNNINRDIESIEINADCVMDGYQTQNDKFSFQCTEPFDLEQSLDDQIKNIAEIMSKSNTDTLLLFIHGFNNDSDDIIKRTKLIDSHLDSDNKNGNVVITAFNWKSRSHVLGYISDLTRAAADYLKLFQFVKKLKQHPNIKTVDFRSHSMGNYLFWSFLNYLTISDVSEYDYFLEDSTIISVAADVNRQEYEKIVKTMMIDQTKRYKIKKWIHFFNYWDVPLKISEFISLDNNGRAGRFAIDKDMKNDNIISIECNKWANSHSYIDEQHLLHELKTLYKDDEKFAQYVDTAHGGDDIPQISGKKYTLSQAKAICMDLNECICFTFDTFRILRFELNTNEGVAWFHTIFKSSDLASRDTGHPKGTQNLYVKQSYL
eukprot:45435_1